MKASRKSVFALIGAMAMGAAMAAPSVEIVSVQQQYPWTNTVDIVYQVEGVTNMDYFVKFTPTTSAGAGIPDMNGQYDIQVALTNSGTYTAQWYPQTNQQYTACRMTPSVFRGAAKDYLIIDLEDWSVTYEPMATQEASNQRYNTDEYKSKKMVFRRVPADTYEIGSDEEANNARHSVTFPEDFYFSLFQLTTAQYERIANGTATSVAITPAGPLSWNGLRGSALVAAKPTSGPLATVQQRTGLCVDLPTRAMYEASIRARVTTHWLGGTADQNVRFANCGTTVSYGQYWQLTVGAYEPNAWGIYDLLGVLNTICRDAYSGGSVADNEKTLPNGFSPYTIGNNRIGCDSRGDMSATDRRMSPSVLINQSPSAALAYRGFRLAVYPSSYYPSGVKH